MVCKLKNKSYSSCFYYTRNLCCHRKPNCKMGKTMRKYEKVFHFLKGKEERKIIEKELEDERKKFPLK